MEFIATLADLCERIPVLWNSSTKNFGSNTGVLLNILNTATSVVNSALTPYYGIDLKLATPRYTIPIKLSMTEDFEDSWGVDLKYVLEGSANSSVTTATEHIIVTATSLTAFSVEGYISGDLGTGDKASPFTSTGNLFTIPTAAWSSGNFVIGDKFIFSRTWYEPILTLMASYFAANQVLAGRYVAEGVNDLDFESGEFLKQYNTYRKSLIDPDYPESLEAPNAVYRNPNFQETQDWNAGYDIDSYGLNENGY